ncbi:radical SAM family heme chaperone HemW [Litoreibacter roseus]|uniref:Heme chaperone HemW n=1 Tax=Litoreibacter roseus TaxID=2601869 RepID=A0A6N6JFJ1_9RHOB|nr:radical SAM family heme chaperone HemW [Litoreibacter roseus]GFE64560.1 coproporphyrinogen III oxidase [Litoreibacter roseus]
MALENWQLGGFGLYIHWPFCQAKCPYCDFNSHVTASINQDRWADAYLNELERVAGDTSDRVLSTVFFGGGTPSLMPAKTVDAILTKVSDLWTTSNDFEVTLEANPTSTEASRFRDFRTAGVNRVSVGVQALNDKDLKALGRLHTTTEALRVYETARSIFQRTSLDLIYARQHQSLSDWEAELDRALAFAPDHLSLYQLTIEPDTAFGRLWDMGTLKGVPDDNLAADMYELTTDMTADTLPAYETSNYANSGSESRHNLIYWRGGDYLAIGPGAHGRTTFAGKRTGTVAWRNPGMWLEAVEKQKTGDMTIEDISQTDRETEYLLMALRLREGADLSRLSDTARMGLEAKIEELNEEGLLLRSGDIINVVPEKQIVLNAILVRLLA